MKVKNLIYLLLVSIGLSSCNQLAVDFPAQSANNALLLDAVETSEPSLQLIGRFSGKTQARMVFQDSLGNKVPPTSQDMALLDPNTHGVYFRIPDKTATFQIDFWKKRSYFENTFYFESIQISNGSTVKVITKDSLLYYFDLINIDYSIETGAMLPKEKNPVPQFVFKGSYPIF